jgi:hypothetical protein
MPASSSRSEATLLAAGLLALLGCGCRGEAEAQPQGVAKVDVEAAPAATAAAVDPKLAIPASWRPMPDASHAMEELLAGATLTGVTVAAWGDAARGCYVLQLSAKEQGARLAEVAAGLRKGFGMEPAPGPSSEQAGTGSSVTGSGGSSDPPVSRPAANAGSAELQFEVKPPLAGTVRARLRDDGASTRLAAVACFFHARYPEQCQRHCARVLASLEAP